MRVTIIQCTPFDNIYYALYQLKIRMMWTDRTPEVFPTFYNSRSQRNAKILFSAFVPRVRAFFENKNSLLPENFCETVII